MRKMLVFFFVFMLAFYPAVMADQGQESQSKSTESTKKSLEGVTPKEWNGMSFYKKEAAVDQYLQEKGLPSDYASQIMRALDSYTEKAHAEGLEISLSKVADEFVKLLQSFRK